MCPEGRLETQGSGYNERGADAAFTVSSAAWFSERTPLALLAWDWLTQLRGVSHPTGRESKSERSARPLFLAFSPSVRSGGLGCGWHDYVKVTSLFLSLLIPDSFGFSQ